MNLKKLTPEQCGYGLRHISLSRNLSRLEFRSNKPGLDGILEISSIKNIIVPQMTMDVVKIQRTKLSDSNINPDEYSNMNNTSAS